MKRKFVDDTIKGRDIIAYLCVKYNNNWMLVYEAIKAKELVDKSVIMDSLVKLSGQYVTIVDSNYPEPLKKVVKPPFVIFLDKIDRDLIQDETSENYLHYFETSEFLFNA